MSQRDICDYLITFEIITNQWYRLNDNVYDHMVQWNLFDVVNSVILKFPADDL